MQGLADELNREGACDRAIFPDENVVITSCEMGSYYEEGVKLLTFFALLFSKFMINPSQS